MMNDCVRSCVHVVSECFHFCARKWQSGCVMTDSLVECVIGAFFSRWGDRTGLPGHMSPSDVHFFLPVLSPLEQTLLHCAHSEANVDLPPGYAYACCCTLLSCCWLCFFALVELPSCLHPFFLNPLPGFPIYPSVAPLASHSSECASQRAPHVLQMGALIHWH